jgi:hypothetical protein
MTLWLIFGIVVVAVGSWLLSLVLSTPDRRAFVVMRTLLSFAFLSSIVMWRTWKQYETWEHRIRHGQCARCGYPGTRAGACPECGPTAQAV